MQKETIQTLARLVVERAGKVLSEALDSDLLVEIFNEEFPGIDDANREKILGWAFSLLEVTELETIVADWRLKEDGSVKTNDAMLYGA